jgi:RNA polymerase sigma-70 factor (ECF subfamily)
METHETRTDDLVLKASQGEESALGRLLERHRRRVRGMVAATIDERVASRIDPSDLVQETMGDAVRKFPEYLHNHERIGFLAWLRQLARRRVIWARRQHLEARKRCVARDRRELAPAGSAAGPGRLSQLADPDSSPSQQAVHHEEEERLHQLLEGLPEVDRTILRLRYAERQPFAEIAQRLGMGLSAVTMHHLRAIQRMRSMMETPDEE